MVKLTVFLADDERVILRGLKKLIDWEALGLELAGEAIRGDELLQAVLERAPDIVIADISMPGMTGIEVLKRLAELGKQTKVIFISAYREFSYAQAALTYGAVDYVIKPVDRRKLEQILLRTAHAIRETAKVEDRFLRLEQYEQKYQRQAYVDFLERLLDEKRMPRDGELEEVLRRSNPEARYSVAVIHVDHSAKHEGSWHEGERKLINFAIHNIASELLPAGYTGWAIPNRPQFTLVTSHPPEADMLALAAEIQQSIGLYIKVSATIGLGHPVLLENLPQSSEQAAAYVAQRFFAGTGRLIAEPLPPASALPEPGAREKAEKLFLKALAAGQEEAAAECLGEWLEIVRAQAWGNREYALTLCASLLSMAARELSSPGLWLEEEAERRFVHSLHEAETWEEAEAAMRNALEELVRKHPLRGGLKEAAVISQVKAYIDGNYREELSLETMAARFYMNPSYFSTFFKKHTGTNFKQYVTDIRMKTALHLLQHSDAMLYEIADKVGYNSARQFSELFRKHYGVLPNAFRKRGEEETT